MNRITKFGIVGIAVMSIMAQVGAATVADDLTNFTLVVTNFTSMVTSILAVFLTPPLLYFTVLTIFVAVIGIVKRLMHAGGR